MGLFGSKNKNQLQELPLPYIPVMHKSGLPGIPEDQAVIIYFDSINRKLIFHSFALNKEVILSLSKVTDIFKAPEEIVKEKSGVGRAIAGGLLFGPTGAVVGAATKKDKKKTVYYDVINYSSNETENSIVLFDRAIPPASTKFFEQVKTLIPDNSSVEL